jgi:hypothetical protein
MRMINQAVAALVAIAGFKKAGQYQQAQQAIDQALEQLLGLRADLIHRLDDEAILRALTRQDKLDVERLALVADLFKEEGDVLAAQGQAANSQASYLRALNFYLEAGLADETPPPPALTQKAWALAIQLGPPALPDDTLWALFCYAEQAGQYNSAESALSHLAARPGVYADLRPELLAFYQRLLALPPTELARHGLSRAQIEEKLVQIQSSGPDDP